MRKIQYKVENLNAILNVKDLNVEIWAQLNHCCQYVAFSGDC